jgi:hypothetical protein
MDYPGMDSLMESIRKINEMSRRARSGDPDIEQYLRSVGSDPVTEWFTALLREKNEELAQERQRSARLASALRAWYRNQAGGEADMQLVKALREGGII